MSNHRKGEGRDRQAWKHAWKEKVVEVLRHGRESVNLVKVRGMFPERSFTFRAVDVGKDTGPVFHRQTDAHLYYYEKYVKATGAAPGAESEAK